MKVINLNYSKVKAYISRRRPPQELRSQIDLGFKHSSEVYELFEIRPSFDSSDICKYVKNSFAKFKFVKSQKIWKLYWKRASGKWESYGPMPKAITIDEILQCIEDDIYGCFYG